MVAGLAGLGGERLERRVISIGQLMANGIGPALELARLRHVEPVEKGSGVASYGPWQITRVQGSLEFHEIAIDAIEVEAEIVRDGDDDVVAERGSENVGRVGEEVTGALGVGLRPQHRNQLVATYRASPRGSECDENGQPPALRGAGRYLALRIAERRASEQL